MPAHEIQEFAKQKNSWSQNILVLQKLTDLQYFYTQNSPESWSAQKMQSLCFLQATKGKTLATLQKSEDPNIRLK